MQSIRNWYPAVCDTAPLRHDDYDDDDDNDDDNNNNKSLRSRVLDKLTVTQLVTKFPAFMETRGYRLIHKRPPLVPILSQMHPPSHPVSLRSIPLLIPIYALVFQVTLPFRFPANNNNNNNNNNNVTCMSYAYH
jgi:hypothetical protein